MPNNGTVQQKQARHVLANALRRGYLTRPYLCDECGENPGVGKDGRSLIHGHHYKGYDYPLDVMWLCISCHTNEDLPRRPSGEGHPRMLHNDEEILSLLRRFRAGEKMSRLSKEANIHPATLSNYNTGRYRPYLAERLRAEESA